MPEKKNQHFIPRFYLKKFSLHSQEERVGVFNISSLKFIESANLYDQASKNYFYGRDLKIENGFQKLETESAKIINSILEKQFLPAAHSRDHQMLLMFIIRLLGRTVYAAEMIQELVKKYQKTVSSISYNALSESEKKINLTLTDAVQESLSIGKCNFPLVRDLHWKLLINETQEPFITSDHPVVVYNQFLEHRKTYGSNVGLASKGLEVFLPLSPQIILILFDKDVYKVGAKNKYHIQVNMATDIKALNLLQYINANKNIYFNDKFSEKKVQELLTTFDLYRRKSKANCDQYPNTIKNEKQKVLLHLYGSDVKCSLRLSFVSLLKKAKSYSLGQKVIHVRDEQLCRLHEKFLDLVYQGLYHPDDFYEFINDCKRYQI
ncbi:MULTISPECIES: DUF4238 domain-containing protein [Cyanophyceae]|uniref:DUF4238 domain-containing protein n=1 Tax=Cyanophyceae TaxID=3028117 RepID=UPI00232CBE43|nr:MULTISPECIES: DUF4238 domain-containing protein [Cyanophyceae]MDB9358286.1 DUF4238 domain-containing protein [Nodularia spumigena CS-587/03]MDB9306837.1 DUF4238 domain-containing protein [Nodularia spumigena CS-591/12]MDB9339915.1 DUF4238 domain-containing protein [Nodularia spumigena CS-589/07]MDB9348670.1 DUF4238 domain-containing protein [Nodularia spumigena CS-588/01]MDB9351482.1 DUF4238 domain-containing protein [Nodularia spumigena CS-588/05]